MGEPRRKQRDCPVCACLGEREVVHRHSFSGGLLGDGYSVVICANCGAAFADGIASQVELDSYYAEQSKYGSKGAGDSESIFDMNRFELIVGQTFSSFRSKSSRILDVGCATGGLLSAFKSHGFTNLLGVDPSADCGREAARRHQIDVRVATLAEMRQWPERFDAIFLVGVLEHLSDVQGLLSCLSTLLEAKGFFYVAVPDIEGLAKVRNAPFQQFSMEHVNFFSSTSLNRVMGAVGFGCLQGWQHVVEWRENIYEPIVAGVFSREKAQNILFDDITKTALSRYVTKCAGEMAVIRTNIERLANSKQSMFVWGAGAFTRWLLTSTDLGRVKIEAFIDTNVHYQGQFLAGRPIRSPDFLKGKLEPILVGSLAFEQEILKTIKETMRLPNKTISLFS
jgi:SAM-dependent methyltransferase